MGAKLVAYEHVPLGFEMVIGNTGVEMGKIWNLWWNVELTDDPEAWDSEIKSINEMQSKLGELSMDQRLIRAQMAEFCKLHPLFPQSIDILCKEIGDDTFSNPVKMGCEGRGLLDSLGYHNRESLNEQREETFLQYAESLKKWLKKSLPDTPTEFKVFGFLGQSTPSKMTLVEKLIQVVDSDEISLASLRRLAENVCLRVRSDFKTLGRPFNCFRCLPDETSIPRCQCCYSMFLDACLLCAGTSCEKKSMLDEFRRFIEENILVYSIVVNSWLKEAPRTRVESLITACHTRRYIPDDKALEIVKRVHSSLGEKRKIKEWLAACLLKTIKDNQRWHKRLN